MFKDQILKKGMQKAPDDLEIDVLLYAAENIEIENEPETELSDYLSWLPGVSTLFLLRDLLSGQKIRINPIIEI
ncbi:MAG: hypothetical protein HOK80_09315 [Candidatus Cloacimonetes bacterium]|jgi:hypothetical protein|nr:hypothetical protein [Candidatus Cloacimonadota bacterium]MBT4333550.1 hypothetical protein [Candidatus Cloacimonadota bacterium]MBT4575709.1 hypothetical protein [Candidatus Cloacimonadota bacterium]MBT5421079.1 hypothetical protein [Candidatus Cloacimonadota bacterium]